QLWSHPAGTVRRQLPYTTSQQRSTLQPRALSVITGTDDGGRSAGPYRGDQRWRSSYRSNANAAQRAINQHAKKGLLYLGEWHTHPEEHPKASPADRDAITRLRSASETRSSALLMLIQGNADGVPGLALYSLGPEVFSSWTIFEGYSIADG
ncbi:Mov34/MPN/PAD-1 family protein, partial [Xanthomonas perforans]|nr:Mov34/MPN/PAD-1 family protein [Xanthomonas perforans]MBZ3326184.1 Mov34/MPN/PAD-1 family protein [Xanthomonas perforans]MBZ3356438.1 Mov34/MPN/PAD-1 family protein [Xanthomonas perforans]